MERVGHFEASRKFKGQSTLKANPVQTKIGRIEAALKVLGVGSVGCQDLSRGCSAEGEDGECRVPRFCQPPTRRFCCRSKRESGLIEGISGSFVRRPASPRGSVVEGPCSRNSGPGGATIGRVREVLRKCCQAYDQHVLGHLLIQCFSQTKGDIVFRAHFSQTSWFAWRQGGVSSPRKG